jgi:secondary thiamine-phosphate synthase enzyme
MNLQVSTDHKRQVVDITDKIEAILQGSGVVNMFLQHTTAALTTADLDPGTDKDIIDALEAMTPSRKWRHPHDPNHFPDHLWSTVIGTDLTLPYIDGKLLLGTWQRVVLIELDGPRERQIQISLVQQEQ